MLKHSSALCLVVVYSLSNFHASVSSTVSEVTPFFTDVNVKVAEIRLFCYNYMASWR